MRLYNTLSRQEEEFAPQRDGIVRMYACGLTVYARGHIGNFRTFLAVDLLRRTLRHVAGFRADPPRKPTGSRLRWCSKRDVLRTQMTSFT